MIIQDAIAEALEVARHSTCAKSHRGVVIWKGDRILGTGFNSPPEPFSCGGTCQAVCGRVAVHAEQRALLMVAREDLIGAEMLHVKADLKTGELLTSKEPCCSDCSKLILEAGLAGMWLWEDPGYPHRYTAKEFHRATLKNCFPDLIVL